VAWFLDTLHHPPDKRLENQIINKIFRINTINGPQQDCEIRLMLYISHEKHKNILFLYGLYIILCLYIILDSVDCIRTHCFCHKLLIWHNICIVDWLIDWFVEYWTFICKYFMHIQHGQFSSFTSSDISSKMKNNIGLNASFQEFIHVLMVPMKSQTE
jgi:hypothetical protein